MIHILSEASRVAPGRWSAISRIRGSSLHTDSVLQTTIAADPEQGGRSWLLIRRNIRTGELAFYRCWAPRPVPLRELVRVAGRRWTVEESFQSGKGLAGLDQHQVRRWTSWRRWTLLAILAHAFLAVLAATAHDHDPQPDGLIPLTRNEIHHLLNTRYYAPSSIFQSSCAGQSGADAINTAHESATTSDEKSEKREDHELRLPY